MKYHVFAKISRCLTALSLFTVLMATGLQAQTPAPAQQITQPATAAAAQPFDGKKLYQAVFALLRDEHIVLVDAAARQKFVDEWEHKHDSDQALATEESTDKAISEMVRSLHQRFDYYLTPAMAKEEKEEINPNLVGIGALMVETHMAEIYLSLPKTATKAQFDEAAKLSDRHQLKVEEVFPWGPAAKAGLKEDDVIIGVAGQPVAGHSMSETVGHIRGEAGTSVTLEVQRTDTAGNTTKVSLTVARAKVHVPVAHYKTLGNGIAYIRLDNFMSESTATEMYHYLKQAAKEQALIIDLRNDPGGQLPQALAIAGFMIPDGFIVNLRNRDRDHMDESRIFLTPEAVINELKSGDPAEKDHPVQYKSEERPPLLIPATMPIVVLVNGYSASASELLTGALMHNLGDRVKVVGLPTVGKNVGQHAHQDLPFDRALSVTAFDFQAGGVSFDWVGIAPNITVPYQISETDVQLEAAKKAAADMLSARTNLQRQQEEQRKKQEEMFKDVLK